MIYINLTIRFLFVELPIFFLFVELLIKIVNCMHSFQLQENALYLLKMQMILHYNKKKLLKNELDDLMCLRIRKFIFTAHHTHVNVERN